MSSGIRMAVRTMSFDSNSNSERWHLGRKLILLILLVIALALGLVILFRHKADFPLLMFNIFADATLGVAAGLAVRVVLKQRNWFVQGLVCAALAVIGLLVLGYFTGGKSGIVFSVVRFFSVNWLSQLHIPLKLPLQIKNSPMDWLSAAYLVIVMDISWIVLRAWKHSSPRAVETSVAPSGRTRKPARVPHTNILPRFTFPKIQLRGSNAKPKVRKKRSERPLVSTSTASGSVKPVRSRRWNPLQRKPQIQLAVYEEHRCPYCLEEVKRNDPRGVVECEVCHALHHKDCWDITGACQVPHLNT